MGARRDDVTGMQRARIAIEVLSPHRPRGTVSRLARDFEVSRQTIYDIAAAGERLLVEGLVPGPHGPQPAEKTVDVDRDRLVRSTVVLTEVGVSQRDVSFCLEEILDTSLSPSWVNDTLTKVEEEATTVNGQWQPAVGETLSGDEIYSNGAPNLLVVGNDSLPGQDRLHLCLDPPAHLRWGNMGVCAVGCAPKRPTCQ
jgi:transposase-like protein